MTKRYLWSDENRNSQVSTQADLSGLERQSRQTDTERYGLKLYGFYNNSERSLNSNI